MKKVLVLFALLVLLSPAFAVTYTDPNKPVSNPVKGFFEFFGGIVDGARTAVVSVVSPTAKIAEKPVVYGGASSSVAAGIDKANEVARLARIGSEEKAFNALVRRANNALHLTPADYSYLHEKFGKQYHLHVYPIYSDGSMGKGAHVVLNGNSLEFIVAGEKDPVRKEHDVEIEVRWEWLQEAIKSGRIQQQDLFGLLFSNDVRVPFGSISRVYDIANIPSVQKGVVVVDYTEIKKYEKDAMGVNQ